jgi:hypothetical protein
LQSQPAVPPVTIAPRELTGKTVLHNADLFGGPQFQPVTTAPVSAERSAGQAIGDFVRGHVSMAPGIPGENAEAPPATTTGPTLNVDEFVGGLAGTSSAPNPAGVSTASAAQFDKPTAETPLPGTDTTPDTNVDRAPTSITQFGVSPDELAKRKQRFAGF